MDVARRALEGGIELGGELRFAAVLFVDIIGSTELATKTAAERVVEALNAFFAVVVEVTEAHGGWVNKFQGDAALCVFGLPAGDERCAAHALAAARTLALRRPPARAPGAHSAGAACVGHSRRDIGSVSECENATSTSVPW